MSTLIKHGADVNARSGVHGSALQAAVWSDKQSCTELLLEHGADANAGGGIFGGSLQIACLGQKTNALEQLLKAGANPNIQGGVHGNPMNVAFLERSEDIVSLFLENGFDVDHHSEMLNGKPDEAPPASEAEPEAESDATDKEVVDQIPHTAIDNRNFIIAFIAAFLAEFWRRLCALVGVKS